MPVPAGAHISHFNFKRSTEPRLQRADGSNLLECTVENSIHLPDLCTLRLHDAKFKYIDEATLDPGKKIEIFATYEQMTTPVKIFCGEVTGIDVDLPRGYDADPYRTGFCTTLTGCSEDAARAPLIK